MRVVIRKDAEEVGVVDVTEVIVIPDTARSEVMTYKGGAYLIKEVCDVPRTTN